MSRLIGINKLSNEAFTSIVLASPWFRKWDVLNVTRFEWEDRSTHSTGTELGTSDVFSSSEPYFVESEESSRVMVHFCRCVVFRPSSSHEA